MDRPLTEQERKELVLLLEHMLLFDKNVNTLVQELARNDKRFNNLYNNCAAQHSQAESIFINLKPKLLK